MIIIESLIGSSFADPATANELASIADALGTRRTAFEGLASRADCTGPNGSFTTEIISLADGTVRFVQVRGTERSELLVIGDEVHEREAGAESLTLAPPITEAFVRRHEVHRILLDLEHRFRIAGSRSADNCLSLVQATPLFRSTASSGPATSTSDPESPAGAAAKLCLDPTIGRPRALELTIAEEVGGGTVRIELADWRSVLGVDLPYEVDFLHESQRFTYRFTEILPFRIAPGAPLPSSPDSLHERLGDFAEIASIHRQILAAHLDSDVEALLAHQTPIGTASGRGKLSLSSVESMRERLGPYFRSTRFARYEDTAVPIIAVSLDGTLGWLACEIEAAGEQTDENGKNAPLEFGFSWVELLAREQGRWLGIGNASSQRP